MKELINKHRQSFVWAVQYNHSWDSTGYATMGLFSATIMSTCIIGSAIEGSVLGVAFFTTVLLLGLYVGIQIWRIINNMDYKIKIWSTVRLKSGGPEMLVTSCGRKQVVATDSEVDDSEYATCKWKDENGNSCMADFNVATLDVIN